MEDELRGLLDRIHSQLLLHPDAGTTRMELGDFWTKFYGFENEIAKLLDDDE